ncbi:MAG: RnfH family protein [Gammaproteobacteria bacterium]|nr:RnfH family protein [Gammaproteobacteria bacterium]
MRVEVAYAEPGEQVVVSLELDAGATARDALLASGLAERFTGIDVQHPDLGIFGERVAASRRLVDGDRVEIYRPLEVDPRTARRLRAARKAR